MSDSDKQNKCEFLSDNKCELGHFGGIVSPSLCRACIKKKINHKKFRNIYYRKTPSLTSKTKRFLKEIKIWVMSGFKLTPEQLRNKRLKICKSCDFFKKNTCQKCGCLTNVKARLETSKCPINKW